MNAERLLAHYEQTADAPDAIARLRRFILELAVRGKLVPQDAADESAIEFDRAIASRLATPFDIPEQWKWARLERLGTLKGGGTPSKSRDDYWNGNIPWVSPKDMKVDYLAKAQLNITEVAIAGSAANLIKPGSVLFVVRGMILAHSFPAAITRVPLAINQDMKALVLEKPEMAEFILRALKGLKPEMLKRVRRSSHGTCRIEGADYSDFLIPIPPLGEQHRIVAKVDELMVLCDRLEAARAAREAVRDRLTAASLARLNAPDPETFQADARFALEALPALTTRPDQIKALRQSILNLAVRGHLVPQDAKDEPASELLKRIAREKARLVKEGKAKRQDLLPEIDLDQMPFELPVGWAWGRFPEVGTFGRGKSKHRPRNDPALFDGGEHLMIQTGDVARSHGDIETYTSKYNDFGLSQSFKWPKGTLCITIAANIADSGILSFDACFPDSVVGFVPASMFQNARYFEYFVRTAKANLLEFAPATAQKNINLEILAQVLIPLPPLAEQHRIVAKVDALMALCDRLEAGLTATAATRRRLLEALLSEALAPADARELEAAE